MYHGCSFCELLFDVTFRSKLTNRAKFCWIMLSHLI